MNIFVLKSDLEILNEKNYKEEVEKASNCLLKHFNDNKQEYTTNAMNSGLFFLAIWNKLWNMMLSKTPILHHD